MRIGEHDARAIARHDGFHGDVPFPEQSAKFRHNRGAAPMQMRSADQGRSACGSSDPRQAYRDARGSRRTKEARGARLRVRTYSHPLRRAETVGTVSELSYAPATAIRSLPGTERAQAMNQRSPAISELPMFAGQLSSGACE